MWIGTLAASVFALGAGGWWLWREPAEARQERPADRPLPPEVQVLLDEGLRAFDDRRFSVSVEKLERAAERWPHSLEIFFRLGRAYWGQDRPYAISLDKGLDAFRRAVALDVDGSSPMGLEALRQLALACVRSERLPEARAAYEQLAARETDPERIDYAKGQIEEIDLDTGVFVPPPDAWLNARGEVLGPIGPSRMRTNQYFEKGRHTLDPTKEEAYYRKAIETDPMMHQGYNNLGVALMHQGRCDEAIPMFREAQHVWQLSKGPTSPPYPEANTWLLRCHVDLGDLDAAVEQWKVVSTLPPDNWMVLHYLRLKILAGQAGDTIPTLEQAAAEDPEHVEVLQALATAYAAVGRYPDAARTMADALAVIPPGHAYFRHLIDPWRQTLAEWQSKAGGRNEP